MLAQSVRGRVRLPSPSGLPKATDKEASEKKLILLHKKHRDFTGKWALRPKEVAKFCCIISLMQLEIQREAIRSEQISNNLKLKKFLTNDIYALEKLAIFAQVKRKKKVVSLLNDYINKFKIHLAQLEKSSDPASFIKAVIIPIYTNMLNQLKENMTSKSMRLLLGINTSASNQQLEDYLDCIGKRVSHTVHSSSPIFSKNSSRVSLLLPEEDKTMPLTKLQRQHP